MTAHLETKVKSVYHIILYFFFLLLKHNNFLFLFFIFYFYFPLFLDCLKCLNQSSINFTLHKKLLSELFANYILHQIVSW